LTSAKPELQRVLGLWAAVSLVIGIVIGSGIFLVPKRAVIATGSIDIVFLAWIVGGLLSIAGALTYAELAAAMPDVGGEYVYLREAYGPLPAFIYGWTQLLVAKSGSVATLATGLYLFVANFFPALEEPVFVSGNFRILYGQFFGIAVIVILGFINYCGVRVAGSLQVVVTAMKVLLFGVVVFVGLTASQGNLANFSTQVTPNPGGIGGFFAALVGILWAYDGWNNVNMVSSEIKNPRRNLPLALIFGVSAVMAIYLLANFAYFYVLTAPEVAAGDRVPATMMNKLYGPAAASAISFVAMVSVLAALNGSLLAGARVPFAMAQDGYFFAPIGKVHPRFHTPGNSIIILTIWSCVLMLSGQYDFLYTCTIFASWILYAMATWSVVVLRRKRPDLERPYKTLGYPFTPAAFVVVAVMLLGFTLRDSPTESLLGIGLIVLGLPVYQYYRKQRAQAN
jgi:basic amino acid/polyamine antiporter, APA family